MVPDAPTAEPPALCTGDEARTLGSRFVGRRRVEVSEQSWNAVGVELLQHVGKILRVENQGADLRPITRLQLAQGLNKQLLTVGEALVQLRIGKVAESIRQAAVTPRPDPCKRRFRWNLQSDDDIRKGDVPEKSLHRPVVGDAGRVDEGLEDTLAHAFVEYRQGARFRHPVSSLQQRDGDDDVPEAVPLLKPAARTPNQSQSQCRRHSRSPHD